MTNLINTYEEPTEVLDSFINKLSKILTFLTSLGFRYEEKDEKFIIKKIRNLNKQKKKEFNITMKVSNTNGSHDDIPIVLVIDIKEFKIYVQEITTYIMYKLVEDVFDIKSILKENLEDHMSYLNSNIRDNQCEIDSLEAQVERDTAEKNEVQNILTNINEYKGD